MIVGATLRTFPPGRTWTGAVTDASGRFEVVSRELLDGPAVVTVHRGDSEQPWTCRPAEFMIRRGETVDGVEIELIEGVEVKGRVVDADHGDPVEGAWIQVEGVRLQTATPGLDGFFRLSIPVRQTDERGEFRVRLPPGEVELSAYKRSYSNNGFSQRVQVPPNVRSFRLPPWNLRADGPHPPGSGTSDVR
jgi:hypothetical protein